MIGIPFNFSDIPYTFTRMGHIDKYVCKLQIQNMGTSLDDSGPEELYKGKTRTWII
jgi:hypothetical protein